MDMDYPLSDGLTKVLILNFSFQDNDECLIAFLKTEYTRFQRVLCFALRVQRSVLREISALGTRSRGLS